LLAQELDDFFDGLQEEAPEASIEQQVSEQLLDVSFVIYNPANFNGCALPVVEEALPVEQEPADEGLEELQLESIPLLEDIFMEDVEMQDQ
jgi:hypothetical protein